jgi:hypothetical protein
MTGQVQRIHTDRTLRADWGRSRPSRRRVPDVAFDIAWINSRLVWYQTTIFRLCHPGQPAFSQALTWASEQ